MSDDKPRRRNMLLSLTAFEGGYVVAAILDLVKACDPTAVDIYLKIKDAAIASGVAWKWGDPWSLEEEAMGKGDE